MTVIDVARRCLPARAARWSAVALHNLKAAVRKPEEVIDLVSYSHSGYSDAFKFDSAFLANSFYGIEPSLKSYCGYEGRIRAAIEHGVYFGDNVESEVDKNPCPAIITFGWQRREHLRKRFDRLVFEVGPYIHYASPFLSEMELSRLKSKLGQVMLVFPKHSIERVSLKGDLGQTVEQIDALRNSRSIDTVIVCLYFNDIQSSLPSLFETRGFKVACCGHRSDPLFLSRQKSLIQLADLTVSNSVGTHVGYCHDLDKEHIVIEQTYSVEDSRSFNVNNDPLYVRSYRKEISEVAHAFSESGNETLRDAAACKYWGADKVRSAEELRTALAFLDQTYKSTKNTRLMVSAARKISEESSSPLVRSLFNEMSGE